MNKIPLREKLPKELTKDSIILGLFLSVVLAASNAYLGLYAGMTVGASVPAAVVSMAILRGVLRRGSILENNIVQTIASTGETLAAGVIFTVPALLITGAWDYFYFWPTTILCFTGGMLGVLFMIPLREAHIVRDPSLIYPEGQACASILQAGAQLDSDSTSKDSQNSHNISMLVVGVLFSVASKFLQSGVKFASGSLEFAFQGFNRIFLVGIESSVALISVGYIIGPYIASLTFTGGAIGWFVGVPYFSGGLEFDGSALDAAWMIWSTKIRYLGVGALTVGGIWSIFQMRRNLVDSIQALAKNYTESKLDQNQNQVPRTERNLSFPWILNLLLITTLFIAGFYFYSTDGRIVLTIAATISALIFSFLFVAVASYVCGLVGSSNSPVSGMTISALLGTAVMIYLFGLEGKEAMLATLSVASVVCCAACASGDIGQDLKTGQIVGATPRNQQIAEILGVIVPALFMAPILMILHEAYGIGTNTEGSLKAPQASLFASIVQGFFGEGNIPWGIVYAGAIIGLIIGGIDIIVRKKTNGARSFPIMPIAIGIYLPLTLTAPILLGGILSALTRKKNLTLLASGLIAGESLTGVLVGGLIIMAPSVFPVDLGLSSMWKEVFGFMIIILAIGIYLSYAKKAEE